MPDSFDLTTLACAYAAGRTITDVLAEVRRRMAEYPDPAVWIERLDEKDIAAQISRVESARASGASLPLYGIPFAVKDNIDVAGHPTTAGCPAFSYVARESATVVRKLCDAGAILVGKTNLDQFATGLVGVRSPYGACRNPFDGRYITGGSSAGSAVAVAAGLVAFALGTDTAGSGRVPAAFNNIIGYKPTRGLISTAGVVPACRSLDCVSIFALTCDDASAVAAVARGYDSADPYSRDLTDLSPADLPSRGLRIGVPRPGQLEFFGNADYQKIYRTAVAHIDGEQVEIDLDPFLQAASLLYDGPWIAERVAGVRDFLQSHPDALLPVIAEIFAGASRFSAADAFLGNHRLAALTQLARRQWDKMDVFLLPTTGTIYRRDEIEADPIQLNNNLGRYTNFVNLMDLCGIAVPAGVTSQGLPCGVTLIGRCGQDESLLRIADSLHRSANLKLGATGAPMPAQKLLRASHGVLLAVVGAHLSGEPLNWQLTNRRAEFIRACRTAPRYRLYALVGTTPPKPGLIRVEENAGATIEVEVWRLSTEAFGSFVSQVPAPLVIGSLSLEDGLSVKGFLCEPYAAEGALDITHFGGWRNYRKSLS